MSTHRFSLTPLIPLPPHRARLALAKVAILRIASLGLLASAVSGCDRKEASASSVPALEVRTGDGMRLDPASPKLKYLKIEAVTESATAPGLALTGRVAFDEDHTQRIASRFDGRVLSILVKPGDKVKPGQALVELSSPRVGELQAEAQKARQDFELNEKAVARVRRLKEDGAVSEKDVLQVESEYLKAKSELARSGAELRSLAVSASDPGVSAVLRSQIAGTVVERNVLVGQEVRADAVTSLFTVSDLSNVWVLADVYEQDLALAKEGEPVSVRVAAYPGRAFEGKVAHVGDVVDPSTRTVKVRCDVPNAESLLKPEMFASVELTTDAGRGVILIPSRAVLADSRETRVLVADADNAFQRRVVEIGPEVDGKVRVLRGLRAGERIVTDGAIFLNRDLQGG